MQRVYESFHKCHVIAYHHPNNPAYIQLIDINPKYRLYILDAYANNIHFIWIKVIDLSN